MKIYDLIILGSGPAGLSAGIYAVRYGLNVLIIGKDMGMIGETNEVENYLGIYPVKGLELSSKFTNHAKSLGAEIVYEEVEGLNKNRQLFIVKTSSSLYGARALVYAMGGKKRKLGLKEEGRFKGRGVSYCAVCDAAFYKNKTVAVVGGANSSVGAALLLSKFATKVYLIYRRDKLRAIPSLIERLNEMSNVEVIYNTIVKGINGNEFVESIQVEDIKNKKLSEIKTNGIFIEIGYTPNSKLAESVNVSLSDDNRIIVNEDMSTNVPGFFAAGDVTNGSNRFDQIITAAAEGAIAANSAYKFLGRDKIEKKN